MKKKIGVILVLGAGLLSCSGDDDVTSVVKEEVPETAADSIRNAVAFTGKVVSRQFLGGTEDDQIHDLLVLENGVLAVGSSSSIDGDLSGKVEGGEDYWIARLDTQNRIQWSKAYGGNGEDEARSVLATKDGGYLVSGYTLSSNADEFEDNQGFFDQWLLKLNATGSKVWSKLYGFAGDDRVFKTVETSDGGFISAGFLDVTSSGGEGRKIAAKAFEAKKHGFGEFWVHKLNAEGEVQWRNYYGGSSNEECFDAVATPDGGAILVGATESPGSTEFNVSRNNGSYDFWIIKIDAEGKLLWEKAYGGSGIERAYAVEATSDGNYIVVGDTRSTDADIPFLGGDADVFAIKIDPSGNALWKKTYGGSDFDSAAAVTVDKDGNYIIAGSTRSKDQHISENKGQNDYLVLKVDPSGKLVWNFTDGTENIDLAQSVAVTNSGQIIVTGLAYRGPGTVDTDKGKNDALILTLEE